MKFSDMKLGDLVTLHSNRFWYADSGGMLSSLFPLPRRLTTGLIVTLDLTPPSTDSQIIKILRLDGRVIETRQYYANSVEILASIENSID